MTIAEFAREVNVTQQAVYQKLKRKNIKPSSIQQPESAQLTEEGERILRSLYNTDGKQIAKQALTTASELVEANKQLEAVKKQLEEAQKAREALTTEIDKQTEQIRQYVDRVQELETERDFLRQTIAQENANHQQALAMLQPAKQERGLFAWFKRKPSS